MDDNAERARQHVAASLVRFYGAPWRRLEPAAVSVRRMLAWRGVREVAEAGAELVLFTPFSNEAEQMERPAAGGRAQAIVMPINDAKGRRSFCGKLGCQKALVILRSTRPGVGRMKVLFVHGALIFDGAWWWDRMVEPLGRTSAWPPRPLSCRAASLLRALWRGCGRHVRRREAVEITIAGSGRVKQRG